MEELASTVMDQLNALSTRISAFDGVFQSLETLSVTAPAIGRRVKGSLGVLAAVFDEQCSLLLAGTISRRLKEIANRSEHQCDVYRSVLATRESMTQTPAWNSVLEKYPAILSPIDRFLYIYRCPGCEREPTLEDLSSLSAAMAQIRAQIELHKRNEIYIQPVHECLLRMRDWLRGRMRPGLPWHDLAQRLADRYALLDSWSRLCCSALYALAWRLHESGLYSDSVATAMFLLHQNTEHGRYLHSNFLHSFGQLRACYLSGAFTWEKFALILQAIEGQLAAAKAAKAPPSTIAILRRAAKRYKRLLKVFARTFDTDALYLWTDQLGRQESEVAARLPKLSPFGKQQVDDDEEDSDSSILELRHWLSAASAGRPDHLRRAADGGDVVMEQGDSRSIMAADADYQQPSATEVEDGVPRTMLRTLLALRGVSQSRLVQLVDSGDSLLRLMERLERHLRLILDCLAEIPSDGQPLSGDQLAKRDRIEADANLLLGALARLMRLAADRAK